MRKDPVDILEAYQDGKLEDLLNSWTYNVGDEYAMKKLVIGEFGYFPNIEAWIIDIERIWKAFRGASTIKGKYTPTIISISRRALGYDLRRSEMSVYFSKKYEEKKKNYSQKIFPSLFNLWNHSRYFIKIMQRLFAIVLHMRKKQKSVLLWNLLNFIILSR